MERNLTNARARFAAPLALISLLALALGGCSRSVPQAPLPPPRPSGQSALMGSTFAGKNTCNPKNHDRPFTIEWDGTDVSSFESRASTDVVFVHYEGCNLQVIDTCTSDSVRGSFGSYMPADWTSGAVEKIDIENEGELYAKLPLAIGSLGGRVSAGEQFHMEYFVAGTRRATRPYVYRGEIDKVPGCRGVTHAVYAYNLGAFALASVSKADRQTQVLGSGQQASSLAHAEKRAGELASCSAPSAREAGTCQAPIRLSLREIQDGDNPDAVAAVAPETPDALNLAGKLQASTDREREAQEHASAAQAKLIAGDGRGCLRELDTRDRLDPRPSLLSTNPKGSFASTRGACLMLSGQCDAGKAVMRKYLDAATGGGVTEQALDNQVGAYCRGADAQPRDRVLRAMTVLTDTAHKADKAACLAAYGTLKQLGPGLKPDDPNSQLHDVWRRAYSDAPRCLARADSCASAWSVAKEAAALVAAHNGPNLGDVSIRNDFVGGTRELCLGKAEGPMTPREELLRSTAELALSRQAPPAPATCQGLYATGRAVVFASPAGDKADQPLQSAADHLREAAVECFTKAADCTSAWHAHDELSRWRSPTARDESIRDSFRGSCQYKPQGALPPRQQVLLVKKRLRFDDSTDAPACRALRKEQKALLAQLPDDPADRDLAQVRDDLDRDAATCLVRANDCAGAQEAFRTERRAREEQKARLDAARGRRPRAPETDTDLDRSFHSFFNRCAP